MRRFNVTGLCNPNMHYMVDITGKLEQIKEMIDYGDYFTINQGRQYGKTTTLSRLTEFLKLEYTVVFLSFENWDDENFATSENFCQNLLQHIKAGLNVVGESVEYQNSWLDSKIVNLGQLSAHIEKMCEDKKIVLMIDEVDKISNSRVFLQFLGILRAKYLQRADGRGVTFHSVILVGVYDIKNIKLKMINDGIYTPSENENNLRTSPWNIATAFEVEMSFNPTEIATMLVEYEKDYAIGMDIDAISKEIYAYTSGYPFMVSRICQIIHTKLDKDWSEFGVCDAFSILIREDNQLFKDLSKNLENSESLYKLMYDVLILAVRRSYTIINPVIEMAHRYDYIKPYRGSVGIANKVFETVISNYFVSKGEEASPFQRTNALYHEIIKEDYFDMELFVKKFADFFNREIFPTKEKELLEIQYRMSFISYLKPFLNGIGNYHLETQLADERRLDVVVNYLKNEYIIELKRVFAESDRTDGINQLLGYMDSRGADTGYLLTFDFRKKSEPKVEWKVEWLEFNDKRILEVNV